MKKSKKIYLLLGGARSGKSTYAEGLAKKLADKVAYLATAKITDIEMQKRVQIHKERRPANWKTFEISGDSNSLDDIQGVIYEIIDSDADLLLIDCMTNLIFRLMEVYEIKDSEILSNQIEKDVTEKIESFVLSLLKTIRDNPKTTIMVSNEVGLGVVPAYPLGRLFRDISGMVNKIIAKEADEVYFFIAGLKTKIK